VQRPKLLSDNGASYVASDPADWLEDRGMHHAGSTVCHPQTQGKIERWRQTLKNHIPLENYYLPGDLAQRIGAFVEHYNHVRYRESIENLTPADVHFGKPHGIDCSRLAARQKRQAFRLILIWICHAVLVTLTQSKG
jgi:putative transposase